MLNFRFYGVLAQRLRCPPKLEHACQTGVQRSLCPNLTLSRYNSQNILSRLQECKLLLNQFNSDKPDRSTGVQKRSFRSVADATKVTLPHSSCFLKI
jgi:hypothetical protein